jgi:tetratricopeptide (TPR) repeat protein
VALPPGVPGRRAAGRLWERAAQAASDVGDYPLAVDFADRAQGYYLQGGQARTAARAQAIAGNALRLWGHTAEARDRLTAAMEVLRADPDRDTVRALDQLATVATFGGSADADQLSAEALALGQDLDVDAGLLGGLFLTRGIYLGQAGRRPQAIAYIRESARLSTQAGDTLSLGRTFLNLSHELAPVDPAAAAEAARTAIGHLRRTGARDYLAVGVVNLSQALLALGDWDTAEAELTQAADADGLAGNEILVIYQAWLAAVRGDADRAQAMLTAVPDMRASEEPQTQAIVGTVEVFVAAARREPETTLRRARATLAYADALGAAHEAMIWTWPLAARTAWQQDDTTATEALLAMLDAFQPGRLPPVLRAERDLARARLAGDSEAAITGQRELSTPYHLAHGLLDYARELTRQGQAEAAAAAVGEATAIAIQLRCQPLLDRAAETATPPAATIAPAPDTIAPATAASGARPRTRATDIPP